MMKKFYSPKDISHYFKRPHYLVGSGAGLEKSFEYARMKSEEDKAVLVVVRVFLSHRSGLWFNQFGISGFIDNRSGIRPVFNHGFGLFLGICGEIHLKNGLGFFQNA